MKKYAALIALMSLPVCVSAELFETTITVNNIKKNTVETRSFGFTVGQDLFDQFEEQVLKDSFSNYSKDNAIITATSNFRGSNFTTIYEPGSTKLIFKIDGTGFEKTFNGKTRTQSAKQLEKCIRRNCDNVQSYISAGTVGNAPTDPIAGGSGSLETLLVNRDFITPSPTGGGGIQVNPFPVGVGGGTYTQNGIDISVLSVPLGYSFEVDSTDPRKKLLLNGQFNYVTVADVDSYQGGLGIGYVQPITDHWSLTPAVGYGIVASPDLLSAGQMFSASINSTYGHKINEYDVSMTNMFGYYKSLPLDIGDVKTDPNISNYVLKNGFFVGKNLPHDVFGHKLNLMILFTDTEFFGTKLFTRQYNEIGFQIATLEDVAWLKKASFGLAEKLSFSAKYVFSIEDTNSIEGYDLGISYQF